MGEASTWGLWLGWFLRAGVGLLAVYLVYQLVAGKPADFVIRLRKGSVQYRGQIPLAHQAAVTQFLLQDLALDESITILGSWNRGNVRLWFRGKLSDPDKQRIRNFFTARL